MKAKTEKNSISIRVKMWIYFFGFTVLLLVIIWLLQVVLLQNFYTISKTRDTLAVSKKIVYGIKTNSISEEDIQQSAYKHNMTVIIADGHDKVLFSSDSFGGMSKDGQWRANILLKDVENIKAEIEKSGGKEVNYRYSFENLKGQLLLYAAKIVDDYGNASYIYVASPLDPINSTIEILKEQFGLVTITCFVLSIVLSYFIAQKLAKPVVSLTNSARKLASGSCDVYFEAGGYGELEELASTLNYATAEISKTNSLRRELMANVSHDLRTPLTMIKMYAEMIRDITGENKQKREQNLNIIIQESDRLSALVNDILDASKFETGTVEIKKEKFDISETLDKIIKRFNVLSEQHGYIFNVEASEGLLVMGDKARIEQVFYNLLSNAVNYTGDDKTINVKLFSENGKVVFRVKDSGKGIPKEQLASIWDRYYRSNEDHVREKVGTGLGLSIVKSILLAHNAQFGVYSSENGSTFWFEMDEIIVAEEC